MTKRRYLELTYRRALADLKSEASRAYLGFIWWLLDPVLYMVIFYIVFDMIFQRGGPNFIAFLLSGLIVWRWFDSSVRLGANSITRAGNVICQVYLPKIILPCSTVFANFIKFIPIFGILLIFLVLYGIEPSVVWFGLPLLLLIQLCFIFGAVLLLSALVPFLPDLMQLVSYSMTLLLFMSGIFFDIATLKPELQSWLYLNPMAVLIQSYRDILLNSEWPQWHRLANVMLVSIIISVIGRALLKRFDLAYPRLVG